MKTYSEVKIQLKKCLLVKRNWKSFVSRYNTHTLDRHRLHKKSFKIGKIRSTNWTLVTVIQKHFFQTAVAGGRMFASQNCIFQFMTANNAQGILRNNAITPATKKENDYKTEAILNALNQIT
jgi:hypothetical protein